MLYEIISFVCIFIATIFVYVKFYAFKYWSEKGVEYLEPGFPFGNISQNFIGAIDYGSLLRQFYQKINGKFGGFFKFHQPVLLIKDTDLIKQILVKDFDHFSDRGIHVNKKDPLSANLFSLSGDEWLNLKNKLIPTFTTEKLKMLFLSIADRNGVMETFLIKHCNNDANYKVDMRDLLDRLTINVIASLAFGVEIDCINNPRNLFRKMCNKAVIPNVKMILMITLSFLSPKLLKWINFKTNDDEIEQFFQSVCKETLEYREKNKEIRPDYMQLLLQIRNEGKINEDGSWNTKIVDDKYKKMPLSDLTAQAFVFFLIGFESTSTTMSFCLFELIKNPELFEKARQNIDMVLKKYNQKITFDSVMEMKYLDYCIDETLRMYPPLPTLNRVCVKDYKIPETNVTIEKDTSVLVSLLGLHFDEKYFPEPFAFRPERFKEKFHAPFSYLPFGEGSRSCIAKKLGKLQIKLALSLLISKFDFELVNPEDQKQTIGPDQMLTCPAHGINLKISLREWD